MREWLAAWEPLLIGAAREQGVSWAELAPALGVASRQAAERRHLRLNPHSADLPDMTGEELENSNPTLAGQVAHISATTDQLRDEHKTRTQ
ncbi:hypothetical protein [Kribbella rubisoli]|uniref:hypothetical protein n=1 Tax=Kribbella rubisoli TaxID=3075929 RepID=UPI00102ADF92|nr:hypothetical protein [Kribbella rubisoli]